MNTRSETVRIGGASGFWGDASLATAQLLNGNDLDFIVYDYLAEITMAILGRLRAKDPEQGFAVDFITGAMVPNLAEIARQKISIISNAGGVNPLACATALRAEIEKQGLDLKVAVVTGDDLMEQIVALADAAPYTDEKVFAHRCQLIRRYLAPVVRPPSDKGPSGRALGAVTGN